MKVIEVLLKILLLMVLPTPKNIKALFGMLNGAIADQMDDTSVRFTKAQWNEIRRYRDGKKPLKRR